MKKLLMISTVALGLLAGCSSNTDTDTDKIKIMTSYYPYALATEEIGGDYVDVQSIYPVDSDAHSYEMTPQQTMSMQDADLIIITNEEEDSTIYNSLKDNDNILSVVEEDHDHDEDEEEHSHSHAWLSPGQMANSVSAIADALVELDPDNKLEYNTTASNLEAELLAISDEYAQFGKTQTKSIVATHDAYSALTEDYGIKFLTLYGAHHDDEPTTKEIVQAVDTIKEQGIKTIFVEQDDTANTVMRQIADEAAVSVETLFTLESESSIKSFDSIVDFYNYNLDMFEEGQN